MILTTDIYGDGSAHDWDQHDHDEHMLAWPEHGSIEADAGERSWLVPPGLGLWVPAGTAHSLRAQRGARFNCSYFDPAESGITVDAVALVSVGPAATALMSHVATFPMEQDSRVRAQRVIVDLLVVADVGGLDIRMPRDPRVAALVEGVLAAPADNRSVEEWAVLLNVSVRTLARIFVAETGTSFARWRTLLRVREAIALLANGTPVAMVGYAVGYTSPSAFSAAFRRETGRTPGEELAGSQHLRRAVTVSQQVLTA